MSVQIITASKPWYTYFYGLLPVALLAFFMDVIYVVAKEKNSAWATKRKKYFLLIFGVGTAFILSVVNIKPYFVFQEHLACAQKGEEICQRIVGAQYLEGRWPVEQDNREAYFWRSLVASQRGLEYDARLRDETARRLTNEEIDIVDKRVEIWLAEREKK